MRRKAHRCSLHGGRGGILPAAPHRKRADSRNERPDRDEGPGGEPRHQPERPHPEPRSDELLRRLGELAHHLRRETVCGARGANTGHRDGRARGEQQRRDLRDKPIANRQRGVLVDRDREALAVPQETEERAGNEVDESDEEPHERVSADKADGAIHRPLPVRLIEQRRPPAVEFGRVEPARLRLLVDGEHAHGERVEGKAGGHLCNAGAPLVDDHPLHQRDHRVEEQAYRPRAIRQEPSHRLHHHTGITTRKDEPRRGDVEREPEEGTEQEQRGQRGNLRGAPGPHEGREHQRGEQ